MRAFTKNEDPTVGIKTQPAPAATPSPTTTCLSPFVNVFETKDGYVLEADLPGVNKSGLEILLEGNDLTIVGRREAETNAADLIYRESKPADFRRVFELDPAIDTQRIAAKLEHGVLTLTLPKSEAIKPRRIMVSE